MKKLIIILLILSLLCTPVMGAHGNNKNYHSQFTESVGNSNIKMIGGVDGDRYEVNKSNKHINIKFKENKGALNKLLKTDDKYHKQTVQIPYSEIEALDNFSGFIKIKHYDDNGINDFNRVEHALNVNGYVYLDLEFSEVVIEAIFNSSWISNSGIITGLVDAGSRSTPCVFELSGDKIGRASCRERV